MTVTKGTLRLGEVGPEIEGPAGSVLTFDPDGRTLRGVPLPSGGGVRQGMVSLTAWNSSHWPTVGDQNHYLVSTGSDFAYAGDPALALTALGALLTYTGPDIDALVTLTLSLNLNDPIAAPPAIVAAGVAFNDDLVGVVLWGDVAAAAGAQTLNLLNATVDMPVVALGGIQRRVRLTDGATLRPVAGLDGLVTDLKAFGLTMSVLLTG